MRTAAPLLHAAVSGLAVISAVSPSAAAPVPKHLMKQGEQTERDKLQGRWKLESVELGGKPFRFAGGVHSTSEFCGDTLTITGKDRTSTAKFKLDTADGVKWLTLTETRTVEHDGTPERNEADAAYGYVLDGDKLTMAARNWGGPGHAAADPAKPDKDTAVFVLTRVKPNPEK